MLAELIGPAGKPSDEEILKFAYTDEELEIQLLKMPTKIRRAFEAFATGVNSVSGYQKPWTSLDSAAIAISMSQQFGAGGAGELRTLALLAYLKSQKAKDSALDVLDDLMWIDDPRSPTTLKPEDDKIAANPPFFPRPTRKETEAHLAGLPEMSIFELLPAVALVEREQADLIAQDLSLVHKWGSYAVCLMLLVFRLLAFRSLGCLSLWSGIHRTLPGASPAGSLTPRTSSTTSLPMAATSMAIRFGA
jgi:penicillin amidase